MMAFKHNCKECPMKFQSQTDLRTHQIVHSDPQITDCNLEQDTDPDAMVEFLRSFFPNLNPSDIPPVINPNSIPSLPDTSATTEDPSSGCKIYAKLANMHVPGMVVPPDLDDLVVKTLPDHQLKKRIRYMNPVRFVRKVPPAAVIQPVYIERPRRSVALIQNTYGDDRCSRGCPDVLRTEVLSRVSALSPTITRVQRLDPSKAERKIEKLKNLIPVRTPKEQPNIPRIQDPTTTVQSPPTSLPPGTQPFPCEICDRSFPTLKTMQSHNRSHVFSKLYSCFLCRRRFSFSYQLNNHLLVHTREDHPLEGNPARRLGGTGKKRGRSGYSCTVCKRSFGRINYLNLHMRCHERKEQVGSEAEPSQECDLESMDAVSTD